MLHATRLYVVARFLLQYFSTATVLQFDSYIQYFDLTALHASGGVRLKMISQSPIELHQLSNSNNES
jgi:hypothetical protein